MQIKTNSIGNYTPLRVPNANRQTTAKKAEAAAKPAPVNNAKSANVTEAEKRFFAGMYPDQKEKIMDYHFYKSSGKMSGVHVGSLFDRKG